MTARAIALASLLLLAAGALRWAEAPKRVMPTTPLASLPWTIGGWRGTPDADFDAETIRVLHADEYVSRTYTRGEVSLDLYVGYYASQEQGDAIHSPMNCLPAAGWQPFSRDRVTVGAGPRAIDANRDLIQKGLDRRLVLSWYQSHGRSIASEYWSKAYLVMDSIRLHRTDGALVRVIVPIDGDEPASDRGASEFVQSFAPILAAYLPG